MADRESLERLFVEEDIEERDELPGTVFEVRKDRDPFDDEILLIRFLGSEPDYKHYQEEDVNELEQLFYDENTPNSWNIQLFWVYGPGNRPPKPVRADLEGDTRYAIRRVVPRGLLEDFIAPFEKAQTKLDNISNEFNRGQLIQDIVDEGLAFLFYEETRGDKLDRLEDGDYDEEGRDYQDSYDRNPIREFVKEIDLGDFRRDEVLMRKLQPDPFTLLEGPNASGKTSLLNGAALGLVGHIRRPEERVSDYPELSVTLENHEEPLATDSPSLNERVADWYGYRPHGPQAKYDEFYRVNYLEAGRATRLVDPDSEVNIQETLKRLLYGEELIDAINDYSKLRGALQKAIDRDRNKIDERETEVQELERTQDRVEKIFSELQAAARSLSPAGEQLITEEAGQPGEEPTGLETWSEWVQRFELLEASLDAVPQADPSPSTPAEIRARLEDSVHQQQEALNKIETYEEYNKRRRRIEDLENNWSEEQAASTPAPVAFIAMVLARYGLDAEGIAAIRRSLTEASDSPNEAKSVIEWQQNVRTELESRLKELTDRKDRIEELSELESKRQELRAEIRSKTEEYLSIVEDVDHCPACYVEQNRREILDRKEPEEQPTDGSTNVSTELEQSITSTEQALNTLESVDWQEVNHAISTQYNEICDIGDFHAFWDHQLNAGSPLEISPVAVPETLDVFARAVEMTTESISDTPSTERVLGKASERFHEKLEEHSAGVPALEEHGADPESVREQYRDRIDKLQTGIWILDDYWPDNVWNRRVDISDDLRVLKTTLDELEEEPESLELSREIEAEIQDTEAEIDALRAKIEVYQESIERLENAFERAEGGAQLDSLIQDHTTVISTLFTAFQRPFEFEDIYLQNEEIAIERTDTGEIVGPDALSSGQRAALALAIFVTNNLAHETAPPVMLLDEPFAHLDDVNTVSFFNLLIELASRRDRQIIFATANRDIADLIERKAGDAELFERDKLPSVKTGFQTE